MAESQTFQFTEDERLGHHARETTPENLRPAAVETRGPTKAERLAAFRSEMFSNIMPTLPKVPGYHLCWCSTNSQGDTIARRESLGYERATPADIPGFDHVTVTAGPFAGCIGLNEMIAMKIPLELYWGYMHIAHSERPAELQERMRQQLNGIRQNGDGVKVELADGSQSFMRASAEPRPMFTE